jgi:hypothetical protein
VSRTIIQKHPRTYARVRARSHTHYYYYYKQLMLDEKISSPRAREIFS